MALWRAYRLTSGNVCLLYQNSVTLMAEKLGTVRADVVPDMILDWIVCDSQPGARDCILLPDGRALQCVPAGEA